MKRKIFHSVRELYKDKLKSTLGVFDLFCVGYADVGSSIYYALGITALYALGATPIAMLIAGVVFICTAFTYSEMSSSLPDSGGSATFARLAFNDLISFLAGWGLMLDYLVTVAISAFAIPPYLKHLISSFYPSFTFTTSIHIAISVFLIVLIFWINFIGIKHSASVNKVLMIFTVLTQLFVIGAALIFVFEPKAFFVHLKIGVMGNPYSPSWDHFLKGVAMAMVAYTGIESIVQLGSETKNPQKTIPKAINRTISILVILYLGISATALTAVTPQELGTVYINDPLVGIVSKLPFSDIFIPWMSLLAIAILFVATNAGLIGISRLSFKMGEFYQLPKIFYSSHKKYQTPYVSLWICSLLSIFIILASRGRMLFLADLYNFGAMIAFFSAHLSLIVLRYTKPKMARPFQVPLNITIRQRQIPIPAIFGALATFAIWVLVVITKPEGRWIGFSWLLIGVLFYASYRKRRKISPLASVKIETVKVPELIPFHFQNICVPTRGGEDTETVQIACALAKMHKAKVFILHVMEIPFALPFDAPVLEKAKLSEKALKRAEAIANDYGVFFELHQARARFVQKGILEFLERFSCDLVVMGVRKTKEQEVKIHKISE